MDPFRAWDIRLVILDVDKHLEAEKMTKENREEKGI
jgi:hypothetical protein